MGKNILSYGMRIIVGIFMPFVYVAYMLMVKTNSMQGVAFLVLSGLVLERYLFIMVIDE